MSWYFVENGERKDPVDHNVLVSYIQTGRLGAEDFVWKKGFENWLKIEDVSELSQYLVENLPPQANYSFSQFDQSKKIFFVRIGLDRGGVPTDYGPYSMDLLKKLYKEKRINAKTLLFAKGMSNWILLAEMEDYQTIFEELPPKIENVEKREFTRKPMVARMFIKNNKNVFEGICRDISVGGMQVLVSDFPGIEGERISINVHPDNSDYHFVADGEIVRKLKGNVGFSFRFINPAQATIEAVKKYIEAN